MTQDEIKLILENTNLEDLKKLQEYYREYLKETNLVNNLKRNLDNFKKDRNDEVNPTKKQIEIKKAINTLKRLPKKRRYQFEGTLNESQKIEHIEIEKQQLNKDIFENRIYPKMLFKQLNKDIFENRIYPKMLFKKSSNGLYNALVFMIISIILYNIGMSVDLIALKIIAVLSSFPAIANCVSYVCNDTLNSNVKTHISQKKIARLIKKLQADYIIEKENSENMHLQNQIFLESKEDIFKRMLKTHQNHLEEIIEEIRTIIESDVQEPSLTNEEIIDTQTLIKNSNQKVLKKSL